MKYQIWDKQSQVITPIGEVLTAEEWKDRYPMSKIDGIDLVIAGGVVNGAFCNEYTSFAGLYDREMKESGIEGYENGIEGLSKTEVLELIENFESNRNRMVRNTASTEERIAAALEAQVLMSMPDVEV